MQCRGFAQRTRARLRTRGCTRALLLRHICLAVCNVGHGLLPCGILLYVPVRFCFRGGLLGGAGGVQSIQTFLQFCPQGAHRPHPRRSRSQQACGQQQSKALAVQKFFDLLHACYSHLFVLCTGSFSGLSVGQRRAVYARGQKRHAKRLSSHFFAATQPCCIPFLVTSVRSFRYKPAPAGLRPWRRCRPPAR